jgi:hypothetical protein
VTIKLDETVIEEIAEDLETDEEDKEQNKLKLKDCEQSITDENEKEFTKKNLSSSAAKQR